MFVVKVKNKFYHGKKVYISRISLFCNSGMIQILGLVLRFQSMHDSKCQSFIQDNIS